MKFVKKRRGIRRIRSNGTEIVMMNGKILFTQDLPPKETAMDIYNRWYGGGSK